MADLPLIDFSPYLSPTSTAQARKEVALAIDQACRTSGFFYLKGHGIPQELVDEILSLAREYFETATDEEKKRIAIKRRDEGGDYARGYKKVEHAEGGSHEACIVLPNKSLTITDACNRLVPSSRGEHTSIPDWSWREQWPNKPENFRKVAENYIDKMESLGKEIIEAIAVGLDVDAAVLTSRIQKPYWNLRILGYEGRSTEHQRKVGIGEHTDFGILTFLLSDNTKHALQVLSKDGEWIDADPIEGCFLCNIGDMLAEWTRGAYRSTLHRVVHESNKPRISIPFFFDPDWDAFIDPVLPALNGADDGKYVGVKYKDKFIAATEKPLWRDAVEAQ